MKDIIQKIYDYSLEEIMGDRFGRYSKYIIQDRAIPDIRDGLKPVQRRIIYSMYRQKNTFENAYFKSAKTVGYVIGNYHPHGDTSVYDAMVRMSQSWKVRNPLIDMQGNNGSIDGDSPAAYRYTEARLSKISNEFLRDLDKNTVSWAPNFDDTKTEPTVLPVKFPNLLVNGAAGISAGYATNIPPHNLEEIIDATIYRIDNPNCTLETMMKFVKGPDFPTGAIIQGIEGIKEAYQTGRGKIIVKSVINFVKEKGKEQIIITEIPYEVNKALLVKKIEDIRIDKKIEGILDVRDESDREGLRIAIDIKKEANIDLICNYLLKNTELQISFNFNMIAIVNRRPKLLGLIEIIDAYIRHQKDFSVKRFNFDLAHAKEELHIVEGTIKALSILDEVIQTIRSSKNKSDAENNLVEQYEFSHKQALAILTLQLYRLTNTDVVALEEEMKRLKLIIAGIEAILSDENKLKAAMKEELKVVKKTYPTPRKTEISEFVEEIKIDSKLMINKEEVVVVVTNDGYIKRVSTRSFAASNGEETALKEQDFVRNIYDISTTDILLLFTNLGNYLYLPVNEIPDIKWKDLGKHISNIIPIKAEERIIATYPVNSFSKNINLVAVSANGMIKKTKLSEFEATRYSKPMLFIKLKENDLLINVFEQENDDLLIISNEAYALRFNGSEVPVTGLRGSGVKAINLKTSKVISGFDINNMEYLTIISDKGLGKRIKISEIATTSRAKKGSLVMKVNKTNPYKLVFASATNSKEIVGIKVKDEIIQVKNSEITIMDNNSFGKQLTKDKVIEAFLYQNEVTNSSKNTLKEKEVVTVNAEKETDIIKKIDDQILTIDDFLDDFEF